MLKERANTDGMADLSGPYSAERVLRAQMNGNKMDRGETPRQLFRSPAALTGLLVGQCH